MYYAYVIKSVNHDYFYKGHCSNLQKRMLQRNSGITTSIRLSFTFVITKRNRSGIIEREKNFKSAAG